MGIDDPADRAESFSMVGHSFESEIIRTLTKDHQVAMVLHQSHRIHLPQLAAAMLIYMSEESQMGIMNEAKVMVPPKGPTAKNSRKVMETKLPPHQMHQEALSSFLLPPLLSETNTLVILAHSL